MHEVSLVAELVEACERRAGGVPVGVVRIRHATSIPASTIQQAFALLAAGGVLADADLETEAFELEIDCGCGFSGPLDADDVIDATTAICPRCGLLTTRPPTAEIELLEVRSRLD
jgi:Zn finger protein HypA/HybF involved in hydrogenase expression